MSSAVLLACVLAQTRFEPGLTPVGAWPHGTPEDVGLDAAAVEALISTAQSNKSDALLVGRRGMLVVERYYGGSQQPAKLYSVTKSILSLAVGILVGDGKLSLDDRVSRWIPAFREGQKSAVTVRHLLTMTAGLANAGGDGKLVSQPDQVAYASALPLARPPGSKFEYSNETAALLSGIVQAIAGEPLDTFVNKRLFAPLGIHDFAWSRDRVGHAEGHSGLSLSARDLFRIGELLLNDGRWGQQQIVPAAYVREATRPSTPAALYGYLFWLHSVGRSAQNEFYADGWLGQELVVIPGEQLIAVRLHRAAIEDEAENEKYGFRAFFQLLDATLLAKTELSH